MAHVANITIQSAKVAGDLTDYDVYVDLSDLGAPFWNTVANGGGDIRVYKDDGVTELAREVVSCDTATKTGVLHFKYTGTLSSSSNTIVKIHADGTSSDYALTATYGRNNVWTDWEMVNHDGGATADSTGQHTFSAVGSPTSGGVTAPTGVGTNFNGSSQYINTNANNLNVNNDYTLHAWIKMDVDQNPSPILATGSNIINAPGYWIWINRLASSNGLCMQLDNGPGGADFVPNSSNRVNVADGWSHIAMVRDGNNYKSYINGSLADSGTLAKSGLNTTEDILIARLAYGSNYFHGSISEIRMRQDARSSDWIETSYNNQNDTSTFYTVTDISGASLSTTKPMQPIWFM
jgi:hypothetical protein